MLTQLKLTLRCLIYTIKIHNQIELIYAKCAVLTAIGIKSKAYVRKWCAVMQAISNSEQTSLSI